MLYTLIALTACAVVCLVLSSGKYKSYAQLLDKKEYPAWQFIHMGLFILELSGHAFNTTYDRWLLSQITELWGSKDSRSRLRLHWAGKLVYTVASVLAVLFVGCFSRIDGAYLLFSAGVAGGAFILPDRGLSSKVRTRRRLIQADFPGFLTKLALLINAGMTVTRAWEKVAVEGNSERPLYKELESSVKEIKSGCPEHRAYEYFARRCRLPEITRTISVLLQNLRKGNSELVSILRVLSSECWEVRKSTARKLGEEASTRMLLPLVLMFLAILLIVATPAVIALRGF